MRLIPIPKKLKIGIYNIPQNVMSEKEMSVRLGSNHFYAGWAWLKDGERETLISNKLTELGLTDTFIHENLHHIDRIFFGDILTEEQVTTLSIALVQILEQLGIRLCYNDKTQRK